MKLLVIGVGHKMPGWVGQGFEEFAGRMPREAAIKLLELQPARRVAGKAVGQLLAEEGERILRAVPANASLVALDERGAAWTTLRLSAHLKDCMGNGKDAAFVIGSADGLDPAVTSRARHVVSLSGMTLPHSLVRVLLAEQLYRAVSILKNHPYHRE
jgi:23S rRNA (pseudouridine1915-N3)-methyltransferase